MDRQTSINRQTRFRGLLLCACCHQADPGKLGSVKVSSGARSLWGGGGSVVSLDAGNIHHYLATSEHEEGRRQVRDERERPSEPC